MAATHPGPGADIFISYAAEDREQAQRLASDLERRGWSVWWDREIVPGSMFSEVIERELSRARAVVVLWSPSSVDSHWVQAEASEAVARGVLVPAVIEECTIPLEFRRVEAAQLGSRWSDDEDEFVGLARALEALVERAPVTPAPRPDGRRGLIAIGTIAVVVVVAGIVLWSGDGDELGGAGTSVTEVSALKAAPATSATQPSGSSSSSAAQTATTQPDPIETLAADPITESGIGPLEVGMRADQIRDALPPGLEVEAYNQQGPLVDTEGVTITDETGVPILYALALPGEGPELGVFVFVDPAFRTAEGVGPGSTVAEATLSYGFATLSYSYENEGREFVDFEYSPYPDVDFRVDSAPGDFAGIYPDSTEVYNTTTEYRDDATIGSVWVLCRTGCPG